MSYQFDEDENAGNIQCPTCTALTPKDIPLCVYCGKPHGYFVTTPTDTNDAGEQLQSVEATLEQRGTRYGDFDNHSALSQTLKAIFNQHVVDYGQPDAFTDTINEALDLIFHKLARVANGDPTYDDNFRDIAGYATLVVEHLNKD